jgi:HEAT repeat protein
LNLPQAVSALGKLLLGQVQSNVRKEAAAALVAIGTHEAREWLRLASEDPDADVRKLVSRALYHAANN